MSGAVAAGKPRQTSTRGSAQPGSCIAVLHRKLQGSPTVGGSNGEKCLGNGENTHLAMRQIQDSPTHHEKERVEA